jgi:hypothetical protein
MRDATIQIEEMVGSDDFAKEIRRRTLEVLRTSMGVEGGFTD